MSFISTYSDSYQSVGGLKYVRTTRFAQISSGTSGSISLPPDAQVVLDDFGGTTDAIITTLQGGKPTFESAKTSANVVVATTFDSAGNYVLSGTPASYPVAIVYRVQQQHKDFDSTASDILGMSQLDTIPDISGLVQSVSATAPLASSGGTTPNLSLDTNDIANRYYHPTATFVFSDPATIWGPAGNPVYDPANWNLNETSPTYYFRMNPDRYTGLRWIIETETSSAIIGPFATIPEYATAIYAQNDGGKTLKVTPFEIIDESVSDVCTGIYAFNSAMVDLFRNKTAGWHRRYYRTNLPVNADLDNPGSVYRTFLYNVWNVVFGNASSVLTNDPLTDDEKALFSKRTKDNKALKFPYASSERLFEGMKRTGWDGSAIVNLQGTVGRIGMCKALVEVYGGTIANGYSINQFGTGNYILNTASLLSPTIAVFPVLSSSNTVSSLLFWSKSLNRVTLTFSNKQALSDYQLDAVVIPKKGRPELYQNLPSTATVMQAIDFRVQYDLSTISLKEQIGTKIMFRLREISTNKVSQFLSTCLVIKKFGPTAAIIPEPL